MLTSVFTRETISTISTRLPMYARHYARLVAALLMLSLAMSACDPTGSTRRTQSEISPAMRRHAERAIADLHAVDETLAAGEDYWKYYDATEQANKTISELLDIKTSRETEHELVGSLSDALFAYHDLTAAWGHFIEHESLSLDSEFAKHLMESYPLDAAPDRDGKLVLTRDAVLEPLRRIAREHTARAALLVAQ